VVGDSALQKTDRGTWEAREVGGTQRPREDITEMAARAGVGGAHCSEEAG
jgi:hypothetical protein